MGTIDYRHLYRLQDEILDLVFAEETEFYLTGGTCLQRFYFEKRYSDDLDLFTNFSETFAYSTRELIHRIQQSGFNLQTAVNSKDFIRLIITGAETSLQVDFVNDRVKRFGDFQYHKSYRLDNPLNILSNKITAVISRDDPKDIFDIYLIAQRCSFNWDDILANAREKLQFQKEDLIYRLQTFPASLLRKLKTTDNHFLETFETDFPGIIQNIKEAD